MVPEKLKENYRKAFERESDWGAAAPSSARVRHRYRGLIRLIEQDMLPLVGEDARFRANLLQDLGHVRGFVGRFDEAFDALNEALALHESHENLEGIIACWTDLANFQRDAARFGSAIASYHELIRIAESAADKADEAGADGYCGLADIYRLQGRFRAALENLDLAEQSGGAEPSVDLEGNILWTRAYVYLNQGHFDKAARCFAAMEARCNDGSYDERDKAPTWAGIGDLHRLTGRYEEALALYAKADASMELQEDRTQRPWVLAVSALTALQLGRIDEARRWSLQSEYLSRGGDPMSVAWALQARGEADRAAQANQEARAAHREALSIAVDVGCQFEEAHSRLILAILDRDVEGIKAARDHYAAMESDWGIETCDVVLHRIDERLTIGPLNFP